MRIVSMLVALRNEKEAEARRGLARKRLLTHPARPGPPVCALLQPRHLAALRFRAIDACPCAARSRRAPQRVFTRECAATTTWRSARARTPASSALLNSPPSQLHRWHPLQRTFALTPSPDPRLACLRVRSATCQETRAKGVWTLPWDLALSEAALNG